MITCIPGTLQLTSRLDYVVGSFTATLPSPFPLVDSLINQTMQVVKFWRGGGGGVLKYVRVHIYTTDHFKIFEPHYQEIGQFYLVQNRRVTSFDAPKL